MKKNTIFILIGVNLLISIIAIGISLYVFLKPPGYFLEEKIKQDNYNYQVKLMDWVKDENTRFENDTLKQVNEQLDEVKTLLQ